MARRDTSDTGGAERKARETMDRVEHEADRVRRRAMEQGQHMAGTARERIRSLFEQQSHRAADQLGGVAHALHQAANQLNDENQGAAARYVDHAAERVERVADTLRESSVDDLVGMVEGYARRQPEVFIGAAFAVGFLFARFVKSSGDRRGYEGGSMRRSASGAGAYGTYAPAGAGAGSGSGYRGDTSRGSGAAPDVGSRAYAGTTPGTAAAGPAPKAGVPDETLGATPAAGAKPQGTMP